MTLPANMPDQGTIVMVSDPKVPLATSSTETATNPVGIDSAMTGTFGPGPVGPFADATPHAKGGLGEVFRATDPILHRAVAVKRLQPHRAIDPASRRRFLVEAEVTARLEHPGVVPVYALYPDASDGPSYAMRFVEGPTLADAIKNYHAGPPDPVGFRRLLQSVLQVCQTVAYAHSRGVIHRDLKPHNVLLGKFGETLVVDWGLAKVVGRPEEARNEEVGEGTLMPQSGGSNESDTQMGSAVGTPAYMSPEQAAGRWNVIDQRSDVYGLGAVLYTVLTGRAPIEKGDWPEMNQKIQRGQVPPARQVKADVPRPLEAVCRKAMALEPAERYATASELAVDVEHWLADEPLSAYREPTVARSRRWMRNHRTTVTVALALLMMAVVGLSVGTVLLQGARRDTEAQRQQAVAAGQKSDALNRFLIDDLLKQADPVNNPVGDKITVVELLNKAAERLESDTALSGQPEVEVELREVIGHAFAYLDVDEKAERQYRKAWKIREKIDGSNAEKTLAVRNLMVEEMNFFLPGDKAEADAIAALEACTKSLGQTHVETAMATANLSEVRNLQGRRAEAVTLQEGACDIIRVVLPESSEVRLKLENELARKLVFVGRPVDAERQLRVAMTAYRQYPARHPELMHSEVCLAGALTSLGDYGEAETLLLNLIPRCENSRGKFSMNALSCRNLLGKALEGLKKWPEAELAYVAVLRDRRVHDTPLNIARVLGNLSRLYAKQQCWDESAGHLADLILTDRPDPSRTVDAIKKAIIGALDSKTAPAVAEPVLRECREVVGRVNLGGDWLCAEFDSRYGECLMRLENYRDAEPILLKAADDALKAPGAPNWSRCEACQRVIKLFQDTNRLDKAAEWEERLAKLAPEAKR